MKSKTKKVTKKVNSNELMHKTVSNLTDIVSSLKNDITTLKHDVQKVKTRMGI